MKSIRTSGRCKVLGILGGMGPEATVDFYQQVIACTPAISDQQHIPTVILSHTEVPDRTESILLGRHDSLPYLIEGVAFLEHAGADVIAIPCNTAHFYLEDLRAGTRIPILSIIEESVNAILHMPDIPRCVAILGTDAIRNARLFSRPLEEGGLRCVYPAEEIQQRVMALIRAVKSGRAGSESREELVHIVEEMKQAGADSVVLGCTELPVLMRGCSAALPICDPTGLLAKAAVNFCVNP